MLTMLPRRHKTQSKDVTAYLTNNAHLYDSTPT